MNTRIMKRRTQKNSRRGRKFKRIIPDGTHEFNDWSRNKLSILRYRGTFMPDMLRTTLVYDFLDYPLMAASASGLLKVAGNSLFDPDKTGTGHQPLGFDALGGAIYQRYRVLASKITITLLRATEPCTIVCTPSTNANYPSTMNDALEARYSSQQVIATPVFKSQTIDRMTTAKIWGQPSITVNTDDLYQALYTADPTKLWYWIINSGSYDGSTVDSVRVNVKIEYDSLFSDLAIYTQS